MITNIDFSIDSILCLKILIDFDDRYNRVTIETIESNFNLIGNVLKELSKRVDQTAIEWTIRHGLNDWVNK